MVCMLKTSKILKYMYFGNLQQFCTVARSHELVAQGWAAFERTCLEVGVGELPQLLQYVKTHTTPTPTATPVKEEQEQELMDVGQLKPRRSQLLRSRFMLVSGGQRVEYRCGNCDIAPKKSKAGMDAHIQSVHTKKALLCSFCAFSMYNFDSLNRHMKEHN